MHFSNFWLVAIHNVQCTLYILHCTPPPPLSVGNQAESFYLFFNPRKKYFLDGGYSCCTPPLHNLCTTHWVYSPLQYMFYFEFAARIFFLLQFWEILIERTLDMNGILDVYEHISWSVIPAHLLPNLWCPLQRGNNWRYGSKIRKGNLYMFNVHLPFPSNNLGHWIEPHAWKKRALVVDNSLLEIISFYPQHHFCIVDESVGGKMPQKLTTIWRLANSPQLIKPAQYVWYAVHCTSQP